jgi:hypothetical protein
MKTFRETIRFRFYRPLIFPAAEVPGEAALAGVGEGRTDSPSCAGVREGRTVPLFVPLRLPGATGRARRPCLAWRGTVRPSLVFGVFFVNIIESFASRASVFIPYPAWAMKLTISINL